MFRGLGSRSKRSWVTTPRFGLRGQRTSGSQVCRHDQVDTVCLETGRYRVDTPEPNPFLETRGCRVDSSSLLGEESHQDIPNLL